MKFLVKPEMDTTVTKLANMNHPRANHSMAMISPNNLYVVGGTNLSGNIKSCEEFSLDMNKWKIIASLNETKKWVSVCTFAEKYLYAFGGVIGAEAKASDKIECLDKKETGKKSWKLVELTSGKGVWGNRFFSGCIEINSNEIMIFGGIADGKEVDECLLLDPTTKAMKLGPKLAGPDAFYRAKHGTIAYMVVIVGSREGDLHIFDKKVGAWQCMLKNIWNPTHGFAVKADTF